MNQKGAVNSRLHIILKPRIYTDDKRIIHSCLSVLSVKICGFQDYQDVAYSRGNSLFGLPHIKKRGAKRVMYTPLAPLNIPMECLFEQPQEATFAGGGLFGGV